MSKINYEEYVQSFSILFRAKHNNFFVQNTYFIKRIVKKPIIIFTFRMHSVTKVF